MLEELVVFAIILVVRQQVRIRRIARRRYKPQKPHKIGIEEAPW